jgi:hypothetical protein
MGNNIDNMISALVSAEADGAGSMYVRPGIIDSFNSDSTVNVRVGVTRKKIVGEEVDYIEYPLLDRVPLCMPYGQFAGYLLTFPIKQGDPCTLLFSDCFLDEFQKTGRMSPPEANGPKNPKTTPRTHHLTDAICIPGFIANPFSVASWSEDGIEIRDMARNMFVRVGADGVTMTDGAATIRMENGRIHIAAPEGLHIDAPNFKVDDISGTGYVRGVMSADNFDTTAGFDANDHVHGGVEPGGGNTGAFV